MTPLILSFKQVIVQESFSRKCLINKIINIFDEFSLSTIKTLYHFSFQTTCLGWGAEMVIRLQSNLLTGV